MNPEQLLAYFNRISDAPDAIPRLRRFILDLAVRGKLVEQDPNDEPAAELLKRIHNEKGLLTKAGKTKESKPLAILDTAKVLYEIPVNWKWVSLGETVNSHLGGGTPSKNNSAYWGGEILWASVKDVGKGKFVDTTIDRITEAGLANSSSNLILPGNLIVVTRMGLGKVSINRVPIAINQDLRALSLSSLVSVDYNYIFFKTHGFEGTGLTVKGIKVEELLSVAFPLPPLAEQHRIVAKVDELMALCDRLEAVQAERDKRRDRLVASSLQRLNQPADSPSLREHARFHLRHLPRLTTRPEHIQQLRQTILNLAVRGKLVRQDPNDEPASELLKRIQLEKARLVKDGKIKKHAFLGSPGESDFPSMLPPGWVPSYLQSLCISVTDGDHLPPPKTDQGIPFLVIGNVRNQRVDFLNCRHVSEEYFKALDHSRQPRRGDLLYTLVGSYGIPVMITDNRPFCVQRHIGILRPSNEINLRFLSRVMESQWIFNQASACATGIAQKTVPLQGLRNFLIPLPPIAEQRRIVDKLDELITSCDQLQEQLKNSQTESRRLLEALLHEALTPLANGASYVK